MVRYLGYSSNLSMITAFHLIPEVFASTMRRDNLWPGSLEDDVSENIKPGKEII